VETATRRSGRISLLIAVALAVLVAAIGTSAPATAQPEPPWNGEPISPGLGPTYDEEWCAAPSGSIAEQQNEPLALIPHEAIECTLEQFEDEADEAGVPDRLSYEVIGHSVQGREIYGVVVNALETRQQRTAFRNWREVREEALEDPEDALEELEDAGDNVKIPFFIEANIHGGEEEGTDAMMQVIRDLVTLPYGTNDTVDALLDHAIVVVIPTTNPDGRTAGTRANTNGFDMNRDLLVQSQQEMRANVAYQLEWLAPVGLALHGYFNPTLIDGLTKPHNPGIEYDKFVYWNQRRLDANEQDMEAAGFDIQRPVNEWNMDAEDTPPPPTGPPYAEGWDDWGPFYTQTYMAFYGVDSSTVEMCSSSCDGRLGSKTAQYVTFYSSADYWVENRAPILRDQMEIFQRGEDDAARPQCCQDPLVAGRGFTEDQHNWMVEYPEAYVIAFDGRSAGGGDDDDDDDGDSEATLDVQRSDAEANRMTQWLLDNAIEVHRAKRQFTWQGQTFPRDSYVVWMDQPFRGLALTALSAGQDVSERITQLYAPPGAWSHGYLWGADVVEIPRGASFSPRTSQIKKVNDLEGGVPSGKSDWYSVTVRGAAEVRAILDLLRSGIDGEVAEQSFTSTSGGEMPAGSLIFPADRRTARALDRAGEDAGIVFERNRGVAKPPTTQLDEAPKVAILVNSSAPAESDTSWSLRQIFGQDVGFVSTVNGSNSLANSPTDPLEGYDVIYNAGQNWPTNMQAQQRLRAFFERGGGYIATSLSSNNFTFLNTATPPLIVGTLTQGSDSADGGIARWTNEGAEGPVTGGYPGTDNLYLPSSITWFSTVPTGATVDGEYLDTTSTMFIAGLWRERDETAAGTPMIVHGATTVDSRYLGLATNPFSRGDAEREWPLIGQAALWSNLTDE
jgi:murein tripeptide amidase MpaA